MKIKTKTPRILFYLLVIFVAIYLYSGLVFLYQGPIRTAYANKLRKDFNGAVVVSLTTTPKRIDKIAPVLDNIREQSLKPDNIYINVPYVFARDGSTYSIPKWLEQYPGITINRSEDFGPGTKLIPTIAKMVSPNDIIITIDDDLLHEKHLIRDLFIKSQHNPDDIITNVSHRLKINPKDNKVLSNSEMPIKDGSESLLVVGVGGVAYRKKFL